MGGSSVNGSSDGGSRFQQRMNWLLGNNSNSCGIGNSNNSGFWPVGTSMSARNGIMNLGSVFNGCGGMCGLGQNKPTVESMSFFLNYINNSGMPDSWKNGWTTTAAQSWLQQNGGLQFGGGMNQLNMLRQTYGSDIIQLAQSLENGGFGGMAGAQSWLQLAQQAQFAEQLMNLVGINGNSIGQIEASPQQVSANDQKKVFSEIDTGNNSGKGKGNGHIDYEEFLASHIKLAEEARGSAFTSKNSPEYKKAVQEATNMFNAIAEEVTDDNGNTKRIITKERYNKMIDCFDGMDGTKDGKINSNTWTRSIAQIKEYGDDAIISNGQTLRELMG